MDQFMIMNPIHVKTPVEVTKDTMDINVYVKVDI